MNAKKRSRIQWFILVLGIAGTVFYFLHVIVGSMYYPGYNPFMQAVSDLTAATAPSKEIASAYTHINGICTVAVCILLCIFYQDKINKSFRLGIYLFTIMQGVSAVGYTLFPLSDSGYSGEFQDAMHVVVTVAVVILSIAAMILIAVGCFRHKVYRSYGVITLTALGFMFIGSVALGAVPAYFGIAERFSVYSVVLYHAAMTIFAFRNQAG